MGSSRTEHLVLTGRLRRALGERWHLVTALTTSEQDFGRDACVHACVQWQETCSAGSNTQETRNTGRALQDERKT